jgi:predicted transcriptional regulator
MDLLLSIQPIIARRISSGKKKWEYRRSVFKKEVNNIYLYSSSPVRKIVCRFKYSGYLAGTVNEIWDKTGKLSAAAESEYQDYFRNAKIAYAIKIEGLVVFEDPPDPYKSNPAFRPPQSFRYIQDGMTEFFVPPGEGFTLI